MKWLIESLIKFGSLMGVIVAVVGSLFLGAGVAAAIKEGCYILVVIAPIAGFGLFCLGRFCFSVMEERS